MSTLKCPVCKQKVPHWRGRQKLNYLQVALDVHMTVQGSYDRSAEDQAKDVAELRQKLSEWADMSPRSEVFDNAVRTLLQIALAEAVAPEVLR